ncbi:bifunctional 23S rRNA (guanine(2069)-N(7))-methyltransferase RlmK/23S rRNA (guanine(2445)-N(2))-methyltransferase RlmL [Dokdonella sp.]|uniref:bifunctional 23S rRNA (guanine(2069)-N(7))-methyltransferase RlmK/23S rRNA (guanine(2445)-N(2))-methyltransferase RlmL n=1 Tax=Dokdonella sp. TaxID=2291710 RepID=UPI001B276587|nr:bifunctional 23S rRNA (guanine(2069)-N(7))-methyltransferase RlmK/23S rRNA (guanine(2445)-N(2))-methyltransferase RlmL [Dokdonella sp.]MBO9662524.1 bifunctional 23S rRNA (guanine(2069)-N(7))-methyltransferase RlmK/23S rRNA (guanine(2445)-N(2))-methyltransferase RlmL [Dokdonella sp.]
MHKLFATCPKGLEYLLRDELRALGADDAREALAGVHFGGSLALAYRACLWSRLASRVLLPLAEFDAVDADALYAGVQGIDWSEHLAVDGSFAVDAVSNASKLNHTQFVALRTKDAIVDQFRQRTGERPNVDVERPSIRLNVRLYRDRTTLSLDLSGTPLHRRGWRQGQGEAPLKENLACAMLLRAGWPSIARADGAVVDPMCGSGTLLIEAALMAADVAPGLRREYFGFLGWRGHDGASWERLLAEANERATEGLRALQPRFFGSDQDPRVLNEARRNAQAAGVAGFLHLARQSAEHVQKPEGTAVAGLVICNPPYGERLGERAQLATLYRAFGARLRTEFVGWRAGVIVADEELGHALGLRADKRYTLYNGALECRLLIFDLAEVAPREHVEKPLSEGAQAVANRITKTRRHLRKRFDREGISCYRVYDADIPEYAAAIDVYTAVARDDETPTSESFPQTWLHAQEYAPPREIPEQVARDRWRDLVRAAGVALDVPRERIATKTRYRGKGGAKYGRFEQRDEFLVVEEGGLKFRVNLFDYLDSGLFLDHRPARARIRAAARGTRFLNLFCYTASASVHAAAGGARTTTSVDLSATYLEWAARNFTLNGFGGPGHQLVQADALEWLRHDRGQYDLIFVDPPTFSNSKRADDFDVQRDHAQLLALCGERLAADGLIVFSNNLRRFTLDASLSSAFDVKDITDSTIPPDFARNARIHRCYELRRRFSR